MNVLDIFLAVLMLLATVYGLWRGFVHIALGIAGFGLGLAAALRWADEGTKWFSGLIATPSLARLAAFAAIFVAALVLTAIASWLGGKLIRAAGIGWLDRLIGGLVGFAGSLLVAVGVILALATFLPPGSAVFQGSRLLPSAIVAVDLAAGVLPPNLAAAYRERRAALQRFLPAAAPGASASGPQAPASAPEAPAGR